LSPAAWLVEGHLVGCWFLPSQQRVVTRAASGRGGRGLSLFLGRCPELEVELCIRKDPYRTIPSTVELDLSDWSTPGQAEGDVRMLRQMLAITCYRRQV
jgi:hypothetical protein